MDTLTSLVAHLSVLISKNQFEEALSHKDFFNLFNRFEVIITEKHGGYEDKPIDEEITNENNNEDY
jgi:hypothetical protein